MSRRDIPARAAGHTVFVGWDRPLQSFFGQVYDERRDEEENPIFWIGADRPGQVGAVDELAAAIAPYAEITPAMRRTLQDDRCRT